MEYSREGADVRLKCSLLCAGWMAAEGKKNTYILLHFPNDLMPSQSLADVKREKNLNRIRLDSP